MTTTTLNKLATLKEIGSMEYRLADDKLGPNIRLHVLRRSLENLTDTTPRKFWGIIATARRALDAGDTLELIAGLALLRSMIPLTWGCVPAGSMTSYGIKRKGGCERDGVLLPHPAADTRVSVIA